MVHTIVAMGTMAVPTPGRRDAQDRTPRHPGSPMIVGGSMAREQGNGNAEAGVVRLHSSGGERITVALIPKATEDLQHLQDATKLSKTDIVNRAITLYEFVETQRSEGRELLVRDRKTGEIQTVLIL
jgi:hypothetical protein